VDDEDREHKKRKTNTKGAKKNTDRFVLFASLPLRFLCSRGLLNATALLEPEESLIIVGLGVEWIDHLLSSAL
jgi:hypothetical protein